LRPLLDLEHLATFVAIVESGSLAGAAARIGRSQSAVSMQLKKLEDRVGLRLLNRDAHGVALTGAGDVLLQHARRFRNLNEAAWSALKEPALEGRVRLGMPDDYAVQLLPPVLGSFAAKHPKVAVELACEQSDSLMEGLAAGRIDVAVFTRSAARPGRLLRREPLVWVGPPVVRAEALDPLPLALYQPGSLDRELVLQALEVRAQGYRIAYSSPSIAGVLAALRAGLAVAAMTRCSVPQDLRLLPDGGRLPTLPALEVAIATSRATSSQAGGGIVARAGGLTSTQPADSGGFPRVLGRVRRAWLRLQSPGGAAITPRSYPSGPAKRACPAAPVVSFRSERMQNAQAEEQVRGEEALPAHRFRQGEVQAGRQAPHDAPPSPEDDPQHARHGHPLRCRREDRQAQLPDLREVREAATWQE